MRIYKISFRKEFLLKMVIWWDLKSKSKIVKHYEPYAICNNK